MIIEKCIQSLADYSAFLTDESLKLPEDGWGGGLYFNGANFSFELVALN